MAGARYWNIEHGITARGTLSGSGPLSLSVIKEFNRPDGASWVDSMACVKSRIGTNSLFNF